MPQVLTRLSLFAVLLLAGMQPAAAVQPPAYTLTVTVNGKPVAIVGEYPDLAACEAAGRTVLQDGRHRRPDQQMTFTCARVER